MVNISRFKIVKIQNKNSINIWQYKTIGVSKLELSKWAIDYKKKRRDDRILVSMQHCALIENLEALLERPIINILRYGSVIDVFIGITMKTFIEKEY